MCFVHFSLVSKYILHILQQKSEALLLFCTLEQNWLCRFSKNLTDIDIWEPEKVPELEPDPGSEQGPEQGPVQGPEQEPELKQEHEQ